MSKQTLEPQFVLHLLLFHLQQHHVYWPGNMSCCVKSSVLRRLAEQKGQKSMLIKECGQLLARGFALIKAKCSCSQETLLIYSSNSEHWLWVRPVGFVVLRAFTKKSQNSLQRNEVCIYTYIYFFLCVCLGEGVSLWQVPALGCFLITLSETCGVKQHTCESCVKSLVLCTSRSSRQCWTRFGPYLAENSFAGPQIISKLLCFAGFLLRLLQKQSRETFAQ